MSTIVTYTDTAPPRNQFPRRIISPTHSGPCCLSAMEDLGGVSRDERYEFTYRRCRKCGFTIRQIVRELVDQARLANLRKVFTSVLARGR